MGDKSAKKITIVMKVGHQIPGYIDANQVLDAAPHNLTPTLPDRLGYRRDEAHQGDVSRLLFCFNRGNGDG
jgi:hypothetical protein